MHAVSISLGATSAIVSIAAVSATQATSLDPSPSSDAPSMAAAPIKVIANSAGHRSTPTLAAFAEHDELLFGEDARTLFARTPEVVVPYLFAFAAVTAQADHSTCAEAKSMSAALRSGMEDAARRRFTGHCALTQIDAPAESRRRWPRVGFQSPHTDADQTATGKDAFLSAEEVLVRFLNHVKRHTIDGACGLVPSAASASSPTEDSEAQPRILLTLVVPRYLFPQAVAASGADADASSPSLPLRGVQWLREAVQRSHLGPASAHVAVLFRDEAAVLSMDALRCRPPAPHRMSAQYLLLPANATRPTPAGPTESAWAGGDVLVVDWGALGVSLTRMRLEGGCLVDSPPPLFLRAHQTALPSAALRPHEVPCWSLGLAETPCGAGDAVDMSLRERLALNFAQQQRRVLGYQSLRDFPARAQRRLLLAAEERKMALSNAAQVPVEIEALAEGVDLRDAVTFSRVRVDAALRGEWQMMDAFEKVLQEFLRYCARRTQGGRSPVEVVVLSGGMLQMPCVAQSLRQLFMRLAGESQSVPANATHFTPELVVMESNASTTRAANGEWQTAPNGGTVGAAELASVGGCLHSYHLALAALRRGPDPTFAHVNPRTKRPGRRQREMLAEAHRVWRALTHRDTAEDDADAPNPYDTPNDTETGELLFLRHALLLYTGRDLAPLHAALTKPTTPPNGDFAGRVGLQLPRDVLSVLFPAHTALPARVVAPVGPQSPLVLYLFAALDADEGGRAAEVCVTPLSPRGISLTPLGGATKETARRTFVVLTLQAAPNAAGKARGEGMQLDVQLVQVAGDATESMVLSPGDVLESVTLDL